MNPTFHPGAVYGLLEKRAAIEAVDDPASVRHPRRRCLLSRLGRHTRQHLSGEAPRPEVILLVAGLECYLRAIGRDPGHPVCPRRGGKRGFDPIAAHPDQRALLAATLDVDQRPFSEMS